jgi:hypothetical protein
MMTTFKTRVSLMNTFHYDKPTILQYKTSVTKTPVGPIMHSKGSTYSANKYHLEQWVKM